MKYGTTLLAGVICGMAVVTLARPVNEAAPTAPASDSAGDPYGAIWLRNVFDLKPAPVVEAVKPTEQPEPPPNVKLTGITTIFGKRLALFSVQPKADRGKPPEKEVSYMLGEGERRGALEVMEIMPKERKVSIKVDDLVSTITFATNSSFTGGGGAPPGRPGGFAPPPGMTAPNFTPPPGPGGGFPRPMRGGGGGGIGGGGGGGAQQGNYSPSGYSPSGYGGGSSGVLQGGYVAPTTASSDSGTGLGGSAFTSAAPQLNAAQVTPILNAEQQQAAIVATHQALMQNGTEESAGMASILPPVPGYTDNANNNTSAGQNPTTPVQTSFGTHTTGTLSKP